MIVGKDLLDEKKYLKETISTINLLLKQYGVTSKKDDLEIIKYRKFLWDNRAEFDEIEINENCAQVALQEQLYSKKQSRVKTLEKQLNTPYFARLDFKEDGEDCESFYIGLSSVEDKSSYNFYVFDWRSPISNMFYDFEIGPAFYNAPNGKVTGEIQFSRQFNIRNGEIVFMHNSNDSLCDENLSTILGGNATDKMKNIVATIQKEQNDIIRNDDSKVLFIQGAAGSGKTSIALHRSAYLLYKNRKSLNADNILIFSPNDVFAEYISDVLPELGESNILQTTFEQYSKNFLPPNYTYESKNQHLDYIYSTNTLSSDFKVRIISMEYKNSVEFMNILKEFIKDLPNLLMSFNPIIIDGNEIISKEKVEKTFLNRFKDIPFFNRIPVVKQSIFSQVETKYLNSNDDFEYIEDKDDFCNYCKEEVNKQIDSMILTLNNVFMYKLLWENINKYTTKNLTYIKDITLNYLNNNEVKYEDITAIIYIRALMEGFRNYKNIKHLLIDEAQDYSPLFYEMIKESFKDAKITIMGDLNQRIDNHSNVKSKEGITNTFPNVTIAILRKSYRSTANITNFTKYLLDISEPIEAVERYDINPTIYYIKDNLCKTLNSIVTELKESTYKSIAIICKNKNSSINLFNSIKDILADCNLITDDNCHFNNGINIIPSYLAKGLEFDAVIIPDAESYVDEQYNNLFYTVCTRALHQLHIISNKPLNKILPKDKSLYTLLE